MFEDVDMGGMPDDIKMYVKNYTYLKRNCVMFMKRLKYRLTQKKLGVVGEETPLLMDLPAV